jgi:hypothetical protein
MLLIAESFLPNKKSLLDLEQKNDIESGKTLNRKTTLIAERMMMMAEKGPEKGPHQLSLPNQSQYPQCHQRAKGRKQVNGKKEMMVMILLMMTAEKRVQNVDHHDTECIVRIAHNIPKWYNTQL